MKKYLIVYTILFIMIFILPAIFTKKEKGNIVEETNQGDSEKLFSENANTFFSDTEKKKEYDYRDYSVIKLLHNKTGEVEETLLDSYLLGVVSAEMPASFEQEALNAQAVVARTYTMYTISHNNGKHENADICDNPGCCQAWISKEDRFEKWEEKNREEYWSKIVLGVNNTKGKIITYNGEPIDAFFHSNSGGTTETPVNVWGGTDYPYLQTVQTSGEDAYSQYSSEVILSKDEFQCKIKEKYPDFQIDYNSDDCIKITEYTESNRVKTIKIGNINISGVEVRSILGLKSTNFKVTVEENNIKFAVIGYGHGVGMSQTGADSLAKQGINYKDIIYHFYTGVEIVDY